jgi:hypothetical protein
MCWRDELDAVIYPYLSLDDLIKDLRKRKPRKEAIDRAAWALEKLKELLEE